MTAKYFVSRQEVETQSFPWGNLEWLSEPRVTESENMVTGYVTVFPGGAHDRHNHPGCEEKLYILEGKARQTIELAEGTLIEEIGPGQLVHVPADIYHSTENIGEGNLVFVAVYQFSGPEIGLRESEDCKIISVEEKLKQ